MRLYLHRYTLPILFICLSVIISHQHLHAQDDDAARLTEYYLADIMKDCKVVLENIEIFTDRDYPHFWEDILSPGVEIRNATIDDYFRDIRRFNKIIDSLYDGYFLAVNRDIDEERAESDYEKVAVLKSRIDQMFAYLYLTTCDFFKAYSLLDAPGLLSREHILRLDNMVGHEYDFPLTARLAERYALIKRNLTPLTLRFNYYLPVDIANLQPYITLSNYEDLPPVSRIYINYFGDHMPWKDEEFRHVLKISELIRFHDEITTEVDSAGDTGPGPYAETASNSPAYSKTYVLPILKCEIDVTNNDDSVRIKQEGDVITLEHKLLFKGFERTDFRILKMDTENPGDEKPADSNGFTLKPIFSDSTYPDGDKKEFLPGDMMPYGLYDLYSNDTLIGRIDLYPCRKGDDCERNALANDITPIKVFDHELVLNKNIIDQVYRSKN